MIRTLTMMILGAVALCASSCCICCTSDTEPPALKPLPKFNDLPTAPEVDYAK